MQENHIHTTQHLLFISFHFNQTFLIESTVFAMVLVNKLVFWVIVCVPYSSFDSTSFLIIKSVDSKCS